DGGGAFIERSGALPRRFEPIGVVTCDHGEPLSTLPHLGSLSDLADIPRLLERHRVGRIVVADVELERRLLLRVLHECKTLAVKVSLLPSTFSALGPAVE